MLLLFFVCSLLRPQEIGEKMKKSKNMLDNIYKILLIFREVWELISHFFIIKDFRSFLKLLNFNSKHQTTKHQTFINLLIF